ncbi:amino acid-binding protein [Parafrankia colletiae]|uniref:Amino acid-binding protein n=1 Tax=Parafrankia colletiae TaxID=573497 RepID=A0A1S1Q444_9ACTN|nr:ABC transporter substrate-binding protein [Parafrankia colletiae]OHV29678.1 amino acid-binding protein [Parafrankia colletiae]
MRAKGPIGPLAMAAVIFVTAIAACSTVSTGSEAVACNSPGVSADEVRIGFVFSDSGAGSGALSPSRAGVDARLGLANEEGGIHGRRIEYVMRDDETSLSRNARAVKELVGKKSVFGLVAATVTLNDAMVQLDEQQVPVVGLAAEATWAAHPNMFSFIYTDSPGAVARYVGSTGGTRAGIVITGTAPSTLELAAKYTDSLRAVGVASELVPFSAASDSPVRTVRQLAEKGVNALIGLSTLDDLAAIMQAARDEHLDLAASVALSGYDRQLLATTGPKISGLSFPVYFRPFEAGGAAIDRYREAVARFAPEIGQPDRQMAMFGYIYTDIFLRGLELAGSCPTREVFISALRNVTHYDAGGLISPVSFRDNAGESNPCAAIVQINAAGDAFDVVRERICSDGVG